MSEPTHPPYPTMDITFWREPEERKIPEVGDVVPMIDRGTGDTLGSLLVESKAVEDDGTVTLTLTALPAPDIEIPTT